MSVNRLVEKFKPEHYELKLDLAQAKNREFNGIVDIFGEINDEKEIALHSKDLEIKKIISTNDIKLNFSEAENDEILVDIKKLNFKKGDKIQLKIEFSGKITDAMHGLYPCYYKENGEEKELFATQFESHHAREVFPCVDEPEAKATFSLEIRALSDIEILSNTEIIEKNENGSQIKDMPKFLKNYTTEFNYLFEQIYNHKNIGEITDEDIKTTLVYNFGNNLRKFLEIYLFFKYPTEKSFGAEVIEQFFKSDSDKTIQILINRYANEFSHLREILERAMIPINIPESKKIAEFVLKTIKQKDPEQFKALCESIGKSDEL